MRRWAPWAALAVVLLVALAAGTAGGGGPKPVAERVDAITEGIRCPTCRSQSAADSDAPAARAIRTEVERRVRSGQGDAEIRAYFVGRYGKDILLTPEGTGVAALVWALPVAAVIGAGAALAVAFRRWRRAGAAAGPPSPEDRDLVERALRS